MQFYDKNSLLGVSSFQYISMIDRYYRLHFKLNPFTGSCIIRANEF